MALRVAVLLSGNGSTLQNIIDQSASGALDVEVVAVLSSREGVFGLERAREAGVSAITVARKSFDTPEAFSETVWRELAPYNVELVVLAGFMSLLEVPVEFANRIMNVHPALIPSFCGKGMYGSRVHQAVLDYGAKITGVTVHFVDNEYDNGPIILQSVIPVLESDTAESLAERVQAEERAVYPQAIQLFAEGRLQVDGRTVSVAD